MSGPIRIGTVKFLNAWPLTHGLAGRDDVALRLGVPSALAAMLKRGEVDVALAPSIDYFRLAAERGERAPSTGPYGSVLDPYGRTGGATGFVALPVAAIGSRGPVGSVRLFAWAEPDDLRRVALDSASRTSNVLARIILARRFGVRPHFVMPDDMAAPARPPDAQVVIGDRALVMERPRAKWALDLGEQWERFVHLPFVYAFWVARADGPVELLVELLSQARDSGLAAREQLAARAARELGIPAEVTGPYLMEQVRYGFGAKERSGVRAFYRMAVEEGLAPEGVHLRMARAGGGGHP